MILVLGGTTEGRIAVKTLDEAGKPFYYSTRGSLQQIQSHNARMITGGMNATKMDIFCRANNIKVIVDAAHPFASGLHDTVSRVSSSTGLPVIRLERIYPPRDKDIIWCRDYDDAIAKLHAENVGRLLAFTGVQTISRLAPFWRMSDTWFRILDRKQSAEFAEAAGFPHERLLYYHGDNDCSDLLDEIRPDAIITKESGESGGFEEKVKAAQTRGLKIFAIQRPKLPDGFITVTGRHGLRREIERLVPEFYPLRTGFTTGACATAASKAALTALLSGNAGITQIKFVIPDGEEMSMPIDSIAVSEHSATATVTKDAGDDPDVTDKQTIMSTVSFAEHDGIRFIGGEGVGTVTLPGLGIPPGEPAINPVPKAMMTSELSSLYDGGIDVTISVPGGEKLATKTFNPRLGIEGGISIIGTSGIVSPFSNEAFVVSIRRGINVAIAVGCPRIVVNSGAKSERYVRNIYPDLPQQAFVHYGNMVGETMRIAHEAGVRNLTIGLMIGKAVKLAEGNLDTHSQKVTFNREFLCSVARDAGCSDEITGIIGSINLARELWDKLPKSEADLFFPLILSLCHKACRRIYPDGNLESLLITDSGDIPYRIK